MKSFLKQRVVYHSIGWCLLIILLFFNIQRTTDSLTNLNILRIVGVIMMPIIYVVYVHFYLKRKFLGNRKYLLYVISLAFIIGSGICLDQFLQYLFTEINNNVLQTGINLTSILLLTSGFQYFKRGLTNQYYNQTLKAKNAEAELKLLKAQLNPHFMFNTLNNIYTINLKDAKKGSDMILELSDVMRYHLQSSKQELVTIQEEVKLIQSYISLEKLRLTDVTVVNIDFDAHDTSMRISPLLLLPFVENAFKYGSHPVKPAVIHLALKAKNDHLDFTVSNDIIAQKQVVKTNIGLENTRKRLELIYPDRHQLTIEDNTKTFNVNLKIHG
jgi:sensor histidine kinase YesM